MLRASVPTLTMGVRTQFGLVSKALPATAVALKVAGSRSAVSFASNPIAAIKKGLKQFDFWDIFRQVRQTRDMKPGTPVGTDIHGNRYFEDKTEQFGKDRWVVYGAHMDFDPATVPAEWHAWLHHITDRVPSQLPKPKYAIDPVYDDEKKTGRDTTYRPPGYLGGKDRGDGYYTKSGSIRSPVKTWEPSSSE